MQRTVVELPRADLEHSNLDIRRRQPSYSEIPGVWQSMGTDREVFPEPDRWYDKEPI
jgi:hypothetical protein